MMPSAEYSTITAVTSIRAHLLHDLLLLLLRLLLPLLVYCLMPVWGVSLHRLE